MVGKSAFCRPRAPPQIAWSAIAAAEKGIFNDLEE
jgi:hypothetical protein